MKNRFSDGPQPGSRIPANIMFIAFPMLCWALAAFRLSGVWLTEPCALVVTQFFYLISAVYLFFAFTVRMRFIDIVGLFSAFASCLFTWIPYISVLEVLLVPAVFIAFNKRGSKKFLLTMILGAHVLLNIVFPIGFITPERIAYHPSPDGRYVALEREYQLTFFGGTDIFLCHASGLFLIEDRVLYLTENINFGGKIEWLDENNISIYGEKMNAFTDPVIKRYMPFI